MKDKLENGVFIIVSSVTLFLLVLLPLYAIYSVCNDFLHMELTYTAVVVILSALIIIWVLIDVLIALRHESVIIQNRS